MNFRQLAQEHAPDAVLNASRYGICSAPDCGGVKVWIKAGKRNALGVYEWTASPVYAVRRSLWRRIALRLDAFDNRCGHALFTAWKEW